ncbi:MAG: hypothetical protein ABI977_15480 [Acidobacteriota bacterium]
MQKISVSWIELILLVLLVLSGMGVGVFVQQQTKDDGQMREPKEETFQQQEESLLRQAELAGAQNEVKFLQEELVKQRLGLEQQAAKVAALNGAYPVLLKLPITATGIGGLPVETVRAYRESQIELEAKRGLVKSLETQLAASLKQVAARSAALLQAQKSAREKFSLAKEEFTSRQQWQELFRAGLAVLALIAAVWLIISLALWLIPPRVAGEPPFAWHPGMVFFGAAAVLSILLGYQTFALIGAAIPGALLVIVVFILLARRG